MLWVQTAVCLVAVVIGIVLHLKWHPLHRPLSEAWDFLMGRPWMVLTLAALLLLARTSGWQYFEDRWTWQKLMDWGTLAPRLAGEVLEAYALSLHGLLPAWPLALVLPVVLSLLVWRLWRRPDKSHGARPSVIEWVVLVTAVTLAWIWLGVEVVHARGSEAEGLGTIRLLLRYPALGVTMAMSQIFVIGVGAAWHQPVGIDQEADLRRALRMSIARWRGAGLLAGLNVLWLAAGEQMGQPQAPITHWIVTEAMLFFGTLPVVVVVMRPGRVQALGAVMLTILLRVLMPWLALGVTAVALLMLTHYACAVLGHVGGEQSVLAGILLPLRALLLATVHSWLFLATVFTFLCHGLNSGSSSRSLHDPSRS